MWILTTGLDYSKLDELREISKLGTQDEPVCCWEFVDGADYYIKDIASGFARIIIWNKYSGIYFFLEGRFKNGEQYNFGRFLNMDPNAQLYNYDQSYTGWFPDADQGGQGIAVVDSYYIHQGYYKALDGFPNSGKDLMYSGYVTQYKIIDLSTRENPYPVY